MGSCLKKPSRPVPKYPPQDESPSPRQHRKGHVHRSSTAGKKVYVKKKLPTHPVSVDSGSCSSINGSVSSLEHTTNISKTHEIQHSMLSCGVQNESTSKLVTLPMVTKPVEIKISPPETEGLAMVDTHTSTSSDAALTDITKNEHLSSTPSESDNENIDLTPNFQKQDQNPPNVNVTISPPSTVQSIDPSPIKHRTLIDECDIPILLELLAEYAYKWREIGLFLGFSSHELKGIASNPSLFENAPNSLLLEMLTSWVEWRPRTQHGKHATLHDLVRALRSKTVGLAAVAEELKKAIKGTARTKTNPLQNTPQKDSVVVRELKPQELSVPALEHYAYYLRSYFTSRNRKPTDIKWPEIEAKKYIRLAVVSSKYSGRADLEEFRNATIHGSIDDIIKSKAPFEFTDLLKPNIVESKRYMYTYPIRRLLLEGAPGIGKSTMSWEVCHKWGSGEHFQEYSLVIMLRFRDSWVQKVKSLSDMLRFPGAEPEMLQEIARQITNTQGKGVLFILEGFDEAPASFRETDSFFFQLFEGSLLPNATVMVTTRPSASYNLRKCCKNESSRRIEVLGFGKKEIDEYIEAHFSQSTLLVEDFHKYLKLYPHIYSMMYVPLNSAIVTHVYQDCKSTSTLVPQTMTQLYTALVKTLLLRYLKDRKEYKALQIDDFCDLPRPVLAKFGQVCQLAYSGITKPVKEVIFSGLPEDFDSLGLMQSVSELYIDKGASVSHNFLHLTIQEFLAAYHLFTRSENKQVAFLVNEKNFSKQTQMMMFLAGFCVQNPTPILTVLEKRKKYTHDGQWDIKLSELHLLFELHNPQILQTSVFVNECQNLFFGFTKGYHCRDDEDYIPHVPEYILQPHRPRCSANSWTRYPQGHMTFNSHKLKQIQQLILHFDFYVLGYIILVSKCKWTIGIDTDEDSSFTLDNLFEGFSMHQPQDGSRFGPAAHVTELVYKNFRAFDIYHIIEKLPFFPNLKHLTVYEIRIQSKLESRAVSDLLASPHCIVKVYDVDIKNAEADSVYSIVDAISRNSMSCLRRLTITNTIFSQLGSLSTFLEANTSLTTLNIMDCKVGIHDIACIVKSIENNTTCTLKYLNLSEQKTIILDSIRGVELVNEFRQIQSECRSMVNEFSKSLLPSAHANALHSMLLKNKTLLVLELEHCELHSHDVVLLAEGLKDNLTLKELNLNNNMAGNEGASAIGKTLMSNSTLLSFKLSHNSIGYKGATALVEGLKRNSSLLYLYLKHNSISNKGFTALLEALKLNSTLKYLDLEGNPVGNKNELQAMTSLLTQTLTQQDLGWQWLKTKNGAYIVLAMQDSEVGNYTIEM